jgi:hypothetical protein
VVQDKGHCPIIGDRGYPPIARLLLLCVFQTRKAEKLKKKEGKVKKKKEGKVKKKKKRYAY